MGVDGSGAGHARVSRPTEALEQRHKSAATVTESVGALASGGDGRNDDEDDGEDVEEGRAVRADDGSKEQEVGEAGSAGGVAGGRVDRLEEKLAGMEEEKAPRPSASELPAARAGEVRESALFVGLSRGRGRGGRRLGGGGLGEQGRAGGRGVGSDDSVRGLAI